MAAQGAAPGDWNGMYFSSTSTGSSLDYVVVQYAAATYQLSHDDPAAGSMCGY
ncbi:MAG: hypothetical protein U0641_01180 [Anaerolineae bacterium]